MLSPRGTVRGTRVHPGGYKDSRRVSAENAVSKSEPSRVRD